MRKLLVQFIGLFISNEHGDSLNRVQWKTRERRPALYHDGKTLSELLKELR